ncbi:hypothetical protein [Dokdonella sp.]|uniref:hypothetical protein n=1 Tax=Dokdonella sp. TaxID=2291710 RepID=UPI00260DC31B|nr:hypothetical protein [Dokdonella sp.]
MTIDGKEVHRGAVTGVDTAHVCQSVNVGVYADGAGHEVKFTFEHTGTADDGSHFFGDVTLDGSALPASAAAARHVDPARLGQSKRAY